MRDFWRLLRRNRNYRYVWIGQVVSEIGDHFNNIAVFSLAMAYTKSGLVVTGVMLARAVPVLLAGPIAGVSLDRLDRKRIMIVSDLARMAVALAFILAVAPNRTPLLYLFSAMLMFASPFFTSGRSSILPRIASPEELHTANSLTQTTQWTTTAIGTMLGGISAEHLGYQWAFVLNSMSFLISACCIAQLRSKGGGGFRAERAALDETEVVKPWHEYREGLRYMRSRPLMLAIALVGVGWATGGGAAQILFSLFGTTVFDRGAMGIGTIWACAGAGLVCGGTFAHWLGKRIGFQAYKRTIAICYVLHGGTYVLFSQMQNYGLALLFIALSRAAVAVSSVLNFTQLLTHVSDEYRGRMFATMESMTWGVMMMSMLGAGIASQHANPRTIGAVAGILSSTTAFFWMWANLTGRLPEPERSGVDPDDVDLRSHRPTA